jgi:hypothetical protein
LREVEPYWSKSNGLWRLGLDNLDIWCPATRASGLYLRTNNLRWLNSLPQRWQNHGHGQLQVEGLHWSLGSKEDGTHQSHWLGWNRRLITCLRLGSWKFTGWKWRD